MSLVDFSTRRLMPTDDVDPYPRSGAEDSLSEFAGRTVSELTDAVQAAIGLLAKRDTERTVHQRRRHGRVSDREERITLDECRAWWTAALLGQGDDLAKRVVERGRTAWRGDES